MATGMPTKTVNNYCVYECISTLQKEVRRGNADHAMYWAAELTDSGLIAHVLSRLEVMAQEDIGLGDPQAVIFAAVAINKARDWVKKKNDAYWLALANAVSTLCAARKSRHADEFQCVIRGRRKRGLRLEIPDYGLDKHTRAGKKLGRGMRHFLTDGAVLENVVPDRPYKEEAEKYWIDDYENPQPADKNLFGDVKAPEEPDEENRYAKGY